MSFSTRMEKAVNLCSWTPLSLINGFWDKQIPTDTEAELNNGGTLLVLLSTSSPFIVSWEGAPIQIPVFTGEWLPGLPARTGHWLLPLDSRIHRKRSPAFTPWMLKGSNWKRNTLLMFFVHFVFLFHIFCSDVMHLYQCYNDEPLLKSCLALGFVCGCLEFIHVSFVLR